jgi:DNA-binding SARP family transcriptional activator
MAEGTRMVAVVGRLGVYPMVRLSLPARRILAYLAIRGQPIERGLAAAELWPDVPDDLARANLRRTLWQTPDGWIGAVGEEIVLDAQTDLVEARRLAGNALDGAPLTLPQIALLSSDILPGWHDEWVIGDQDAFRLLRVQALEAACRSMALNGAHALATQAGAAALNAEPLRESAAEALIDAHLAQRNRYEAAQCFRSLAERLRDELGVGPDPRLTERLVAIGLADLLAK